MSPRLIIDPQAANQWCDAIVGLIDGHAEVLDDNGDEIVPKKPGLRAVLRDLLSIDQSSRPDGYRSSSLGAGSPANVVEEFREADGTVVQLPVPQHSDPTGSTAAARIDAPTGDPVFAAIAHVTQALVQAVRVLEAAESKAAKAKPPPAADPSRNDPNRYCTNHQNKIGTNEEVYEKAVGSRLCRFCYEWRAAAVAARRAGQLETGWPLLPNKALLDRRAQGVRITNRVIRECLNLRQAS